MLKTILLNSTRFQVASKWNAINVVSNQLRFYSNNHDEVQKWISTLDEAQQKRIRFLQNEITLKRNQRESVPTLESLTVENYQTIMNISNNQRLKYYNFLSKTENSEAHESTEHDIRNKVVKDKIAIGQLDNKPFIEQNHREYGLGKNALIPKIYNSTMDKWKNARTLWHEMLGAPKLIFDCSFSDQMSPREVQDASKQLSLVFSKNRRHLRPYSLNFCSMNKQSLLWSLLLKRMPTIGIKPIPLNIHEADASEIFPKEKLVVLTPDSPNLLKEYNNNDIYVINSIVELGSHKPLSIAKAKQLNIRHARLPLENYRRCRLNKSLTLDQMMDIMLEVKESRDWNKAFNYVAKRRFY